jgi:hypothetical protein
LTIQGRGIFLAVAVPSVLLVGMFAFAGCGWLQEHDARVKAETQTGQQQRQIEGLKQQQSETQRTLAAKLADVERDRRRPASAALMVSDAAVFAPTLTEPLRVQTVADDPALPDGPASAAVVIPQADFQAFRDAELSCRADGLKLSACEALRGNGERQLKLAEAQRDEWKTAAKGGSLWHRALGAAKWFAVGAGTGAVVYAVARHR